MKFLISLLLVIPTFGFAEENIIPAKCFDFGPETHCAASFDLGVGEYSIVTRKENEVRPIGKSYGFEKPLCFHSPIITKTPVGIMSQYHGCAAIGIFNASNRAIQGSIIIEFDNPKFSSPALK